MQFKNHASGNLNFINLSTRINSKYCRPLFLFEGSYYNSEEFAVQYYKSKGYYAFFSENEPWKILLNILFKDVFKRLKKLLGKKDINMDLSNKSFPYSFKINEINGKK